MYNWRTGLQDLCSELNSVDSSYHKLSRLQSSGYGHKIYLDLTGGGNFPGAALLEN